MSPRFIGRLTLAWAISLTILPVAFGEEYRDASRHYRLNLPPGWYIMDANELKAINAEAGKLGLKGGIRYEAGFRAKGAVFPYVLVQFVPGLKSGASYAEIEKSFAQEFKTKVQSVEGPVADLIKKVNVGSAGLDRSRNWVVVRMKMDAAGLGTLQAYGVGHLVANGIVFLHGYTQDKDLAKDMPALNQLNEGFQFDAGHAFKPGSGSVLPAGAIGGALIGAAVGLVAGLVGGILAYLFKKKCA